MFEALVDSPKRLNTLHDDGERHFHEIIKLTVAMANKYVCKGCKKASKRDIAHVCGQTCSDFMFSPPCAFAEVRIPATTAVITLETPRVSRTTSCPHGIGNRCAKVSGVARRADGS